ncbi:3'(2'),5'-bisphosphate nucleotidase [Candidatus Vecturithrix granuli]|uniref:3'(2'),5'-bisphosphate nucleotidase n=1 Tax=Vecturithrix granuli TaxID=1499967 RepID=A0A081BYU8_VECG1|nr:3'(2'),5'-bisphosphate nucleotidase [Candidatus Vecturithrix granuli]
MSTQRFTYTYAHERQVAIEAVVKACRLCRAIQSNLTAEHKISKADTSPVTVADFGSQALIVSHLLRAFLQDAIVGEESATLLRQPEQASLKAHVVNLVNRIDPHLNETEMLDAIDYGAQTCDFTQRYWTLDPIDGTKGFLRGDQYAVALALIEHGEPVVGVLGCPNLLLNPAQPEQGQGCLLTAVKGQGAAIYTLEGTRTHSISVAPVSEPSQARFCDSVEAAHASHAEHAKIAELLGITTPSYRIDSQCKYAIVARGEASIYLRISPTPNYRSWIWDHAAGTIVVQEAGGKVTDMDGYPLDFSLGRKLFKNSGVIATNGLLHEIVLGAIRQMIKRR